MNDEGFSRLRRLFLVLSQAPRHGRRLVPRSLLAAGGYSSTLASLASAAGGWRLGMSFLT